MSELPGDLLYTSEHEWLRRESDGNVDALDVLLLIGQWGSPANCE